MEDIKINKEIQIITWEQYEFLKKFCKTDYISEELGIKILLIASKGGKE